MLITEWWIREERSLCVWRRVGVTDYLRYWSQTEAAKHRLKDSGHAGAHINDTQTERPSPVLFSVGALDPNPFYLRLCVWVYTTCKRLCTCGWAPVFTSGCLWWRSQRELISCLLLSVPGDGVLPQAQSDRCGPVLSTRTRSREGISPSFESSSCCVWSLPSHFLAHSSNF